VIYIYICSITNLINNFKLHSLFLRLFYSPFNYLIHLFNFVFDIAGNASRKPKTSENYYFRKTKWGFLKSSKFFRIIDIIYIYITSSIFNTHNYDNFNMRIKIRLRQINWSFYTNLPLKNSSDFNLNHFLCGFRFIWFGLRYWLVGLLLGFFSFYYLTYVRLLPFTKVILEWLLILMFLYWVVSGFVFFIKKYQYSKYTSVIQRFWKRTYILFWLIESGVFLVFFYITLTAPEEPVYMYDQIKVFKTHLFSWRLFIIKLVPIFCLIMLSYFLILNLKWTSFSKQVPILVVITLILVQVLWLEFYQFFHIINYYENPIWSFDNEEFMWTLDLEFRRTRIVNNAVTLCLLAKFWHLIFIFVFWIFFILRINEIGRVRYPLLAANAQNFIILYIMSWLYMYPWLKFVFKRHMETPYYWFFFNARRLGIRIFFNDLLLFSYSIFKNNYFINSFYFSNGLFYYWVESSSETNLLQYKKFIIRDSIIAHLNTLEFCI